MINIVVNDGGKMFDFLSQLHPHQIATLIVLAGVLILGMIGMIAFIAIEIRIVRLENEPSPFRPEDGYTGRSVIPRW